MILLRPKFILFLFQSLILIGAAFAQLKGDTYASASRTKTANVIFLYNEVYGFVEETDNGQVKGLLIDLMLEFEKFVKEEEGITMNHRFVSIEDQNFSRFMSQVKSGSGGVFGLTNVSIKEERKRHYKFSPPYINNISLLITHNSVPTLARIEDLGKNFAGMTAYTVPASTYSVRVNELKNRYFQSMKISEVPSGKEVMEEVAKDKNGFGVVDLNYYLEALRDKYPIKRHAVGDRGEDQFGIIMPLNSDWVPLLEKFFDSGFTESPEYRKIITDNLGRSALRLITGQ